MIAWMGDFIVNEGLPQFISARKDIQTIKTLNTSGRSCTTDCPPGHVCYPKGAGCILGDTRPGRDLCCEFNQEPVDVDPRLHMNFFEAIKSMLRVAQNSDQNRGTATAGFRHDLALLIPASTPTINPVAFRFPNDPRFAHINLGWANQEHAEYSRARLTIPSQAKLITLGSKLFQRLNVGHTSFPVIHAVDQSIRNLPGVYISSYLDDDVTQIPLDVLSWARNLQMSRSAHQHESTILTEQQLFDIVLHKMNFSDETTCDSTFDVAHSNAGVADFSPIAEACETSRFRGHLRVGISNQTSVTEGNFGGIRIYVEPIDSQDEMYLWRRTRHCHQTLNIKR